MSSDFDRADFKARQKAVAPRVVAEVPAARQVTTPAAPPVSGPALIAADHLKDLGWSTPKIMQVLQGPASSSIHEIAAKPTSLTPTPKRAPDAQIVDNIKKRLRAAFLKQVPDYLKALIDEAQPTPAEQKRFDDYKRTKDILKAAEVIEGAVTVLVTAINPLAGAVVGVAVAGVSATQEVLANDIDRYVAPWQKKDAGLNGAYALTMMRRRVYSYRGFTSLGYQHATDIQATFGISLNSPGLAQLEDAFDDYIDALLVQSGMTLGIAELHRYFPVNVVTESFDLIDRDNERILRFPDGTRNIDGRIVPQYAPVELEAITAEIAVQASKR